MRKVFFFLQIHNINGLSPFTILFSSGTKSNSVCFILLSKILDYIFVVLIFHLSLKSLHWKSRIVSGQYIVFEIAFEGSATIMSWTLCT